MPLTTLDKKFLPGSDNNFRGAEWQHKISSMINFAVVGAAAFLTANASGHLVKKSVKTTRYLLPVSDFGNGPKTSTETLSKRPSTGIGCRGVLSRFNGVFLVAQSMHEAHHFSISEYIPVQK